jgi:hypothetical protein
MKVEFTAQAIADLRRLYPEENKFQQVKLFLTHKLQDDNAERFAVENNEFFGKNMYDYPVDGKIALYQLLESPRRILVWTVHEAAEDIVDPPED